VCIRVVDVNLFRQFFDLVDQQLHVDQRKPRPETRDLRLISSDRVIADLVSKCFRLFYYLIICYHIITGFLNGNFKFAFSSKANFNLQ